MTALFAAPSLSPANQARRTDALRRLDRIIPRAYPHDIPNAPRRNRVSHPNSNGQDSKPVIEIRDLHKAYQDLEVPVSYTHL
ncbi:MAG: hypothetical protein MPK62_09960, partial [Alphaproteobacteria bacterium]|nr:hypothetical protein [Alphaproteobacteria bacterium]